MEQKYKIMLGYAFCYSVLFFIVFGVVTVLIPNRFFARMNSTTLLDYVFLALTSLLLGIYLSLHQYQKKNTSKTCDIVAAGGGISGFLSFGCAVCNKILIWLFGMAGVLTYIEPYQPIIGFTGIGLLSYAVYNRGRIVLSEIKT